MVHLSYKKRGNIDEVTARHERECFAEYVHRARTVNLL